MSDMTPQEAQDDLDWARAVALNEAGGGEWEDVLDYLVSALETIAADTIEYGVEINGVGGWAPVSIDPWGQYFTMDKATARETVRDLEHEYRKEYRIVARRVSEPWEVKE